MIGRGYGKGWIGFVGVIGIAAVAYSQGRIQPGVNPGVRNTQIENLVGQLAELQKEVDTLKGTVAQLQKDFDPIKVEYPKVRDGLKQTVAALKAPPGYATALYQKRNFDKLDDNALIRVYTRF